jgi:tetratricopeptide (TPR) repeat protein
MTKPMQAMKRLLYIMVLAVTAISAVAVNPYPQLEAKAERFFNYKEWASAAAIYDLMLAERPEVAETYGKAIVSNAMRGDTIAQMDLMHRALDNHIAFDSVFSQVKQWSFRVGKAKLYENFLKETREAYPWMRRAIDSTLLKYYTSRGNGAEMVTYSAQMLEGAPDSVAFLLTMAQGYMLTGDDAQGLDTYRRVLEVDVDNYDALVALGNWYAAKVAGSESAGETDALTLALDYLNRANESCPTPFVAARIAALTPDAKKK